MSDNLDANGKPETYAWEDVSGMVSARKTHVAPVSQDIIQIVHVHPFA